MTTDFTHALLGKTGMQVCRLGLSATYRPGTQAVFRAIDAGVNYFFGFGIDTQLIRALREAFTSHRERYVLSTGAYNLLIGHPNLRRTLEKRLRQFRTDYIDVFLFLGVTQEKHFPPAVREELMRFREEGKIRAIGISTHDRKFAGRLVAEGALDVLMMRYNAAHRGAERDIFPHLAIHNPGVVSYTSTRWTYLMRPPRGWPTNERVPTAGMAYRFVLSHPSVHVCITAPKTIGELDENLRSLQEGPLNDDDLRFMQQFGDAVYNQKKWFM